MFEICFLSFCVQPRFQSFQFRHSVLLKFYTASKLFFGINVLYLVSKLMMLIVQFRCCPFSGPDVDQRGDPWKLEHVCRKSGHQLRRRPYQEPRWALSFQCSFWRVCLWVRGGLLNIFVLPPLRPPLHPLIIIAGQMSVYWIENQHWRQEEGWGSVLPLTLRVHLSFISTVLFLTFRSKARPSGPTFHLWCLPAASPASLPQRSV